VKSHENVKQINPNIGCSNILLNCDQSTLKYKRP